MVHFRLSEIFYAISYNPVNDYICTLNITKQKQDFEHLYEFRKVYNNNNPKHKQWDRRLQILPINQIF